MTHRRAATIEPEPDEHAYLQIGEVAERTGVTQRTLRFYEEKGLLTPPSRLDGGFRLYSEDDVRRVEQIKRLKSLLGLALADIKEMVEAEEVKSQIRAEYRRDADVSERKEKLSKAIEVTERQVAIIDHKLSALHEMKADLDEKLSTVRGWLRSLEERVAVETRR
ncbi:MAG: MerR family transcriptional regulator [Chloroflexota bacterium]|nr:MerR family transcriptional regulator [Chloroflexota bacterium]